MGGLGLCWAVPGSSSHWEFQWYGAGGDFGRKSTLSALPWGPRELTTRLNTQGHKDPKEQ